LTLTAADDQPPPAGGPARIFAGLAFLYALIATVVLLVARNMFRDEPDRDTVLIWLLLPLLASFGSWIAVLSGFSPLRGWVWFAVLASMFFVWIAAFSIGLFYLPVPLLLLIAVLIPWTADTGLSEP
jgi:hypothetical protein